MAIPAQAMHGDAEADRLFKQAYQPDQPNAGDPPQPGDPGQPTPPTPSGEVQPQPPPSQPTPADDGKWEQRYRTLKGMFDAEMKRSGDAVKALQDQVAALTSQVQQASPKPGEQPQPAGVTDKDVEAFGGDMVDLMRRVAAEATVEAERRFQAALTAKDAEISQLKEQVGGVAERTAAVTKDNFFEKLSAAVVDWQAVNAEQGFLDWLADVDPLTGMERQVYLDDAVNKLDLKRTAALFNAYKATKQPPPSPPPPPPQLQPPSPQQELQRQVQPSTTQALPPVPPSDQPGRVWTNAQVEQFYADQTKGLYRGREDVARQISDEIDRASSEGRIRP